MAARFDPAGPLRGSLRPPPDKSISHRAALVAAMAEGESRVDGYLDAADTRSTLAAIEAVGARSQAIARDGRLDLRIRGVGLRQASGSPIDVGNAGTLLRILPGWLAGQETGSWTIDGDDSIRRRPVDRIVEPLRSMGARISCRQGGLPPIRLEAAPLTAISYRLPIASAQVKSCLLLAGLLANGTTAIVEPAPSRDHTERMLAAVGVPLRIEDRPERTIRVTSAERVDAARIEVPGDFSSAAFPLVAALLVPGSAVRLTEVGLNPTRTGLLGVLERMGAEISAEPADADRGEPSGSIAARASELRGTAVGGEYVPLSIDELPLIALAGCLAEGETTIRDAEELRHKESDRIAAVAEALNAIGGEVEPTPDGMVVSGVGRLRGGRVDARGDHRIAMLGAVAGLASAEGVDVEGFDAAGVSYPGFEAEIARLLGKG